MYRILSAVAAVLLTVGMFVPAMAQSVTVSASAPMPSGAYQNKAAQVSLAGADLHSTRGDALALDRIEAASRIVCGERAGYTMNSARARLFARCKAHTTAAAVTAVGVPELTLLAAAR